ncbi:MAG TPA: TonB-dependent receptor [Bacteroidales bacterium]|nr:TonB-dependent receptor [Bacteroidales bacterium]
MRFFLLITLFLSLHTGVYGQGVVTGLVTDSNTLEALTGVYIVYGRDKGVITGDDGRFLFSTGQGLISVTFRFIGYKEITQQVSVVNGDTVVLDVSMTTEIKEIGQIVVSANKTGQKIAELSVSMDLIKNVDFGRTHITDSKELINKIPGIEVLDGQASIRGGTGFSYGVGSRVLALIDGLPVLSPDAGSIKWQFLPLENISQIEIIKGASSVLYGSSAMNGIINFRTAPAGKDPETTFFAETGVFDRPSNRNWVWWNKPRISSTFSFSHLQKAGNNDIGIGVSLSDYNSYRKFNDESLARLSLRLKHYNQDIKGLSYGINLNSGYTEKTDFVLWENATTGALKQDTSSVSNLHGTFLAIDPFISYDSKGPVDHELKFRLQSAINNFPERANNNSDASSVYGEYQASYRPKEQFGIVGGLSATLNRIVANFYGNHNGINAAGFAQVEGTPLKNLKLVAGIRIESNSLDGITDRIVPIFRTGLNWQAAEYTWLRGSFGQGYRYPSVAEKHAATTLGAVRIYPNPDIQPETGWSSEIGLKQGLAVAGFSGQADVSIFFSQNENMIEYLFGYYPDIRTGQYNFGFQATNVEQSRIYGAETEFMLSKTYGTIKTSISGGYTYIQPEEFNAYTGKNTGNYLKYRRKHSLKLGIDAGFNRFLCGVNLFYRSRILSIDNVFTDELTREDILPGFFDYWNVNNTGYFLLDGNLGYDISQRFNLSLAVKNITNTEYMGRPGDIQPQRHFSLRLTGKL